MRKDFIYFYKKSSIVYIFFLLCFLNFSKVQSNEPKASISIDTNNVLIGDPIKITLNFTGKKDIKVVWPFIPDSFGRIEVLSKFKIDTIENQNDFTQKQSFAVTSFDSGAYIIPSITIMYEKKGFSTLYPIQTDSIQLVFHTVDVDTTQAIKDIKPPLEEPFSIWDYIEYILIGLGVIGLAILGYYLWKRYKKQKQEPETKKPKIPPHIVALEELQKLDKEKLWQNGFIKEYHTRLTDIVRNYLEGCFSVQAIEMTTGEIIDAVKVKDIDSKLVQDLEKLLELADLVKFAKFHPLPDENSLLMKLSIEFVNNTIPKNNGNANNMEGEVS